MLRPTLLALAVSAPILGPAHSQDAGRPAAARNAQQDQLDRIEKKLDEVLRRLDASPAPGAARPGTTPSTAGTAAAGDRAAYRPGAVAVVRPAPVEPRLLGEIPADNVGGFVYTGGAIPLHDLSGRGVRYTGLTGIELQGWLQVRQAGRHQLGADLRATLDPSTIVMPDCILQAWLEERVIGSERVRLGAAGGREAAASPVLGAELQPGLYRLRLWVACTPARNLKATATALLRAPADMNLRGVSGEDLLHRPE